jgi:peptidoglycan-associated lipoprotein
VPEAPAPAALPRVEPEEDAFARKSIEDLNEEGHLAPVYFALDSAELDDAARAALNRNAEWLRRWTSVHARIDGHCDDRGTAEYNLALGDRRARAVRDYLTSLGVDAARLRPVSRGEEEPVCGERSEECWGRNRRAAATVTAK